MSRSILLACSLLLCACRTFEVQEEQVFLRYRPAEDVLDAVLVYQGLGATDETEPRLDQATQALESMGRGSRRFMIFDWPLDVDLEEVLARATNESDAHEFHGLAQSVAECLTNVRMTDARLLEDEERGRLCMLQRLRVEKASQTFRVLERVLNANLLEQQGTREPDESGDPSWALQLERARKDGSWFHFDGTALEVSCPLTPEAAAEAMREMLADSVRTGRRGQEQILDSASALWITDDELRLRFAPGTDGWIRFELSDERRGYRPAASEELTRKGLVTRGKLADEVARLKAKP